VVEAIRALAPGDWEQWLPLWRGYLAFYRAELSETTTRATFDRLTGDEDQMFGFIALDPDGTGLGLAHCITHPTTWSRRPYCYLEDLFVAPAARGSDVGRRLLEVAKERADSHGAGRLYWHTQEYNGRARSLYDQVGRFTSFVVYEM
jgi:GNAT superfamily N-acetyltransferase